MVKIYDDGNLFCKKIPNKRCSYAFVNLEDTAKNPCECNQLQYIAG